MIDLEGTNIFDLAMSPQDASIRKLEKMAEKAADIASIQENVGDDANLLKELDDLKNNAGKILDSLVNSTVNKIIITVHTK